MERKELGKISSVRFGHVGYRGSQLGIAVTLSMGSSSVGDSRAAWDPELIERPSTAKWTEEDRDKDLSETMRFISLLLKQAKVSDITQLKGKPVEVTMKNNTLQSWRILEEVL